MSVTVSADATRRALATLAGHLQDPEGLDSAGRVLEDAVRARSPRLTGRYIASITTSRIPGGLAVAPLVPYVGPVEARHRPLALGAHDAAEAAAQAYARTLDLITKEI